MRRIKIKECIVIVYIEKDMEMLERVKIMEVKKRNS